MSHHESEYRYTVIFEPDLDEGGYVVTVPALGLATQGESVDEARRMAEDAIKGYLDGLRQEGQPIPHEPEHLAARVRTERIAVRV
jgi:antitoxin HicB